MKFLKKIARRVVLFHYYKRTKTIHREIEKNRAFCIGKLENGVAIKKKAQEFIPLDFELFSDRFDRSPSYQYSDKYLYVLNNGGLLGNKALIINNKGLLITDSISFNGKGRLQELIQSSLHGSYNEMVKNALRHYLALKTDDDREITCALSLHPGWINIYHWIAEQLTKLRYLEVLQDKLPCQPLLILPPNPPSYMLESLAVLGYDSERIVIWEGKTTRVKNLLVPTFPEISPAMVMWLRERIVLKVTGNSFQKENTRVFISRNDANKRMIVNQDEVDKLLLKYNFRKHTLSGMSFREQVLLFAHAEVVLAPHGAGLVNILWGDNLKVIEMFGYVVKSTYARLSDAAGHKYIPVLGKCETNNHAANFQVDIIELEDIFKKLDIESSI